MFEDIETYFAFCFRLKGAWRLLLSNNLNDKLDVTLLGRKLIIIFPFFLVLKKCKKHVYLYYLF